MARRRSEYNYYFDFEPTRPIEVKDGIKARSQRGAFAKSWWATRWIQAMERLVDAGRLSRGRSYARKGQVLSIEERKNGVEARVQGSRRTPYKIDIQVAPLSDAQWEKVIDALVVIGIDVGPNADVQGASNCRAGSRAHCFHPPAVFARF